MNLKKIYKDIPFSVLNANTSHWRKQKKKWIELGIKSELGRTAKTYNYQGYNGITQSDTSIFDPFLCELCYDWFNIIGGHIFDPFSGGSVRGIVAKKLGYDYTGIDLRQEQIDANYKNADELDVDPKWFCDDSLNLKNYIDNETMDLIFSCPPYFNLEVYSDMPEDISNMSLDAFQKTYKEIIHNSLDVLKNNRFAIFVVSEIRGKDGNYINFVDFTKQCFLEYNNVGFYNEIILFNRGASGGLRVNGNMKSRKLVRSHQNVLVFFKGDTKEIKDIFHNIKEEKSNEINELFEF